jgi:hypothetical protein
MEGARVIGRKLPPKEVGSTSLRHTSSVGFRLFWSALQRIALDALLTTIKTANRCARYGTTYLEEYRELPVK